MLIVKNIRVSYGSIVAVQELSFEVGEKQIICLVGPNGAGKTTTMRAIMGILPVVSGSIEFQGRDITNGRSHEIARAGLIPVPEGRRIFSHLTVKENLEMGAYLETDKKRKARNYEYVYSIFPELKERLTQHGGTLSGGQQQMLAIARALMANPKVILMDEPSMGLAPIIVKRIFDAINEIRKEGTTILLVEQNAAMALRIADYAYVVERGSIVLKDYGKNLLNREEVVSAYLGGTKK